MRAALVGLLLIGCGRVAFDPLGDADAIADPSLVAWYPLDDEFATDRFARDASGHGRTAACGACPSRVPGRNGEFAAQFDGTSVHLRLPYEPELDFPNAFTIALWANPQVLPTVAPDSFINRPYGAATADAYGIDMKVTGGITQFEFGTAGSDLRSVRAPATDTWFHLVATWDGAIKRLYIDGILDAQVPRATMTYDVNDILIGADADAATPPGNFFRGLMFDVRIYDRALSDPEIAVLAQ